MIIDSSGARVDSGQRLAVNARLDFIVSDRVNTPLN